MAGLCKRDTVFVALSRSQMFAGVANGYFVVNAIFSAEIFLISKAFWALAAALVIHLIGIVLCLRNPRFFDLWNIRVSRCPRVKNHALWGCNSYRP